MRKTTRHVLVGGVLLAASSAPAPAKADGVQLQDVAYVPASADAKIKPVKLGGADAVEVSGPGTPVRLDCTPFMSKAGASKALSSVKVGIRHLDKGTHGFEIALVHARPAAKAGIQDDTVKPAAKAGIQDDTVKPVAKVGLLCNGKNKAGAATIVPEFAGSKTFSVRIMKSGQAVKTLTQQSGALSIADFDTDHSAHEETLGVTIAYGIERAGAWTIKLEHDAHTILITAESAQPSFVGGGHLMLSTSGLESVTLVDQKIDVAQAMTAPAAAAAVGPAAIKR